jgi:hypothetical protein
MSVTDGLLFRRTSEPSVWLRPEASAGVRAGLVPTAPPGSGNAAEPEMTAETVFSWPVA